MEQAPGGGGARCYARKRRYARKHDEEQEGPPPAPHRAAMPTGSLPTINVAITAPAAMAIP